MQRGPDPAPKGTPFDAVPDVNGCSRPVVGVMKNALTVLAGLLGVKFGPRLAMYTNLPK